MLYVTIWNLNTKQLEHFTARAVETLPCTIPLPKYEGTTEVLIYPVIPLLGRKDASRAIITDERVYIRSAKYVTADTEDWG